MRPDTGQPQPSPVLIEVGNGIAVAHSPAIALDEPAIHHK
jgi:hypothetical protein